MKTRLITVLTLVSLATLGVSQPSYAWTLSTHPDGYRITCGNGFVGHFDGYPTEFACNKVCENRGGVVNIEPNNSPRLAYMQNQEIRADFLEKDVKDEDENQDVRNVLDKRYKYDHKAVISRPTR